MVRGDILARPADLRKWRLVHKKQCTRGAREAKAEALAENGVHIF